MTRRTNCGNEAAIPLRWHNANRSKRQFVAVKYLPSMELTDKAVDHLAGYFDTLENRSLLCPPGSSVLESTFSKPTAHKENLVTSRPYTRRATFARFAASAGDQMEPTVVG